MTPLFCEHPSGIRCHFPFITASAQGINNIYEAPNGVTLGATEALDPNFILRQMSELIYNTTRLFNSDKI